MSKLRAYKADVTIPVYGTIADAEVYLKPEADKVIAEKDKEIKRQNTEIKNAVIDLKLRDKKNDELTIALKEKDKELRHHKYKRCLAMARWCNDRWADIATQYVKSVWYRKWQLRWLELAKKFKEAK